MGPTALCWAHGARHMGSATLACATHADAAHAHLPAAGEALQAGGSGRQQLLGKTDQCMHACGSYESNPTWQRSSKDCRCQKQGPHHSQPAHAPGWHRSRSSWGPWSHRCTARHTSCRAGGSRQTAWGWRERGCLTAAARLANRLGRRGHQLVKRAAQRGSPEMGRAQRWAAAQGCCRCRRKC